MSIYFFLWSLNSCALVVPEYTAGFQLREIGRITNLATTYVKRYLNELVNEELIIKSKHRIHAYPV